MDTEYKGEIKLEDRKESQCLNKIPAAVMSTGETVIEGTASNPIELPFWKPDKDDNVITHAVYRQLIKRYIQENQTWDSQMRSDLLAESQSLDYGVFNSTRRLTDHILHRWMKMKITWPRFWTIRVMFGPAACARQAWFPEVLERFPDFALKSAYTGVVPLNLQEVLELDEWEPPDPTPEECGYDERKVNKRRAASIGIRSSKRQKGSANSVSTTATATTATTMIAATASPTTTSTLQRDLENNNTEAVIETSIARNRQSLILPDINANGVPLTRNIGGLRNEFRPCQEMRSQINHPDMQNQLRELGDENHYLRQVNALQQRLIERYQEKIFRLEEESREMRRRG
ncbi:hypothetical protein GGI43DRAFT_431093 [Trichoderma evansii]